MCLELLNQPPAAQACCNFCQVSRQKRRENKRPSLGFNQKQDTCKRDVCTQTHVAGCPGSMKKKGEYIGQDKNCSTNHPICSSSSLAQEMLKSIFSSAPLPSSSTSISPSQRAQKKKKSNSKNPNYEAGSMTPFGHSPSQMLTFQNTQGTRNGTSKAWKALNLPQTELQIGKARMCRNPVAVGPALLLHFV